MIMTEGTTQYHFIITLDSGSASATYSGVAGFDSGAPRSEVFDQIMSAARVRLKIPGDTAVLFFSLEPERLAVTASTAGE